MKRKLLFLIVIVLLTGVQIQAQTTTFKYTSSEKLTRFEEFQYFVGATGVVSHDWDAATGEGVVVYEGTVTELGSNALQWQSTMTALEIPEGVTTLGFQSVQACPQLSSVSLPKSLKHVKGQAFYYTGFEKGKFIIDDLAWWCSITFDGMDSNPLNYAKHVYSDEDTEITDLVIPEGVTSIGSYAFVKCEGIKSVKFPSTLTAIGSHAFDQSGLESVAIPESITEIEEYTFSNCANLKSVTIPEGVTKIGFSAFAKCGIESLTLPSTVSEMSQSFYQCEQLSSLTISEGVTKLNGSFYSCHALKEVHIPSTVQLTYQDFMSCNNLETVTFAEGMEEITGFRDCRNLKSVTFPSTTSKVESYGFRGCSSLTSVTCLALEPPVTTGQIPGGSGVGMEGRTLYVPALAQDYYKEAKNWQDFPSIETLDMMPQNIIVRDEMHLVLPKTVPEGKPAVSLRHENDPKYGILTVDGGQLSMSDFSTRWEPYMQYWRPDSNLNFCSLINNTLMEADKVSVDLWIYSKLWTFAALPFDFKVSEVEPCADGTTDWVIYTYDSQKRADGEMTETWVKMTGDDIIKAGQGFIVQGQRTGADKRTKDDVALRFKAIDNASKNLIFRTDNMTQPLTVYDSEFMHNRSWNFVGNPFPCYFDMNSIDFRAPITVWNMNTRQYVAVRPGDDYYVFSPGEGFFVQCPDDKDAILFREEGRQTTRDLRENAARTRTADDSRTIFNINMKSGNNVDCTRIVINEEASVQYELDKDACKFFPTESQMPLIYTLADGASYAINERPLGDGIVHLCATSGYGYFTITLAEDRPDWEVMLEDPETGKTTLLKDGEGYSCYAQNQTLLLHIRNTSTGIKNIRTDSSDTDAFYNLHGVRVTAPTAKGIYIQNGKKVIK